jgi:hypothetical protein
MLLLRLLLTRFQFHIVVSQYVAQDNLDLYTCKESARTSPEAVPKVDVVYASSGVLILVLVSRRLSEIREAKRLELGGVWIDFRVLVDGMSVNGHTRAVREDVACGTAKPVGICDDTRNIYWVSGQFVV